MILKQHHSKILDAYSTAMLVKEVKKKIQALKTVWKGEEVRNGGLGEFFKCQLEASTMIHLECFDLLKTCNETSK